MPSGILYIIATPIGNLSDITIRALDTLKEVSLILSEDTRETSKLLDKYSINKPQISYRDQNHLQVLPRIIDTLSAGQNIALMSDSGTPLVSDPGFKLVRELITQGYTVASIPGPSAVIASLVVSGLPTDKFTFIGFLPKTRNQRVELIKQYGELDSTLIIYESPFRVKKLLEEIFETLGDRMASYANDLTKKFEKVKTDRISLLLKQQDILKPRGEFVILVAKKDF